MITKTRCWLLLCAALVAVGAAPGSAAAAPKSFKQKDCIECHKKFDEKYGSAKVLHSSVKQRKCEDCHLRHGIVPQLVLKKAGDELCYSCHKRESIGMTKKNVHPVLRAGDCTQCHDAHGSNAPHMLKAEGAGACYECHDKAPFERKNVHAVLKDKGCTACHVAHASDERALLAKGTTYQAEVRLVAQGNSPLYFVWEFTTGSQEEGLKF